MREYIGINQSTCPGVIHNTREFPPQSSGGGSGRSIFLSSAATRCVCPSQPPSHPSEQRCSWHCRWWRGGVQSRCSSFPPWPCPEPLVLSSRSQCPGQRWPRPAVTLWGSSPEHGQWQCAASVPRTAGCLCFPHWCCSPGGDKWSVTHQSRDANSSSYTYLGQGLDEGVDVGSLGSLDHLLI